jgi:hypothetical protein
MIDFDYPRMSFMIADNEIALQQCRSDETPVGMIFSDMRAFRLYDGPTEVQSMR